MTQRLLFTIYDQAHRVPHSKIRQRYEIITNKQKSQQLKHAANIAAFESQKQLVIALNQPTINRSVPTPLATCFGFIAAHG